MRYKIIGIVACIIITVLSFTLNYSHEENERIHQHMVAVEKEPCTHGDDVFCTHLPLVQINTHGKTIPGYTPVNLKNGDIMAPVPAEDGLSYIVADLKITDHKRTNNHPEDEPDLETMAQINVRGRTSRTFDKPNYSIRLIHEDGSNNPQEVMGMGAHHEWALHGPFLDKTLIQNYMWYNIAGSIMDYAPNVRFCELIINGEYRGLYLMTETITAGKDSRLQLSTSKKNNTFLGYLLRLDMGSRTPVKNISSFTHYTYRCLAKQNIEYPGVTALNEEMNEAIRLSFSRFEKALYSYDFDDKVHGYRGQADINSFVDYFLINELTCNYDVGALSTYIYYDVDKLFRMCVWDFNSACDGYRYSSIDPQQFMLHQAPWFVMLFRDEYFVQRTIDRYRYLRTTYFSNEYLDRYIDETVAFLGPAIARNYEKWGYTFNSRYDFFVPEERNPRNYSQALARLRNFLRERTQWMDENIETLLQHCADSKVKKFKEHTD